MLKQAKGTPLLLGATLCWGLSIPLSKGLLGGMPPLLLIAWQLLGSLVLLLAVAAWCGLRWWEHPHRVQMALIGTLEPGLAYGLGFIGMLWTSAIHTAVLFSAEPFAILLFGAMLGWSGNARRPDAGKLLAGAASVAGVALIAVADASDGGGGSLKGDALVLAGVLCAALYVALSARHVQVGSPLALLILQQLGSLLLAGAALVLFGTSQLGGGLPDAMHIFAAMAVGMLQFALAFWFYFQGLKQAGTSFWSLFVLNLTPVIGVAASAVLLAEPLVPQVLIGGALTVSAAIYLYERERRCGGPQAK